MKTKRTSTRLTAAAVEAFREEKHRDRVALAERVRRGELTAREAFTEASVFKRVPSAASVPVNYAEVIERARNLTVRSAQHGRRREKAVHA